MTRFRLPGLDSDESDVEELESSSSEDNNDSITNFESEDSEFTDSEEEEFPVQDIDHWGMWNVRTKKQVWDMTRLKATTIAVRLNNGKKSNVLQRLQSRNEFLRKQEEEVTNLLSQLKMTSEREEEATKLEFEKRSKKLWDEIELSIAADKNLRASERAALERAKKLHEDQERKSQDMRNAELRKIAEDKERREREKHEEEEKLFREREENARRIAQEEEKKIKSVPSTITPSGVNAKPISESILKEEQMYKDKLAKIKEDILRPVSNNSVWSKACFNFKGLIKRKISQVTNSRIMVYKIAGEINDIFIQAKNVSTQSYEWCLNFYSKAIIKQAEKELILSRLSHSYPLARICVLLASLNPQLVDLLMIRFVKKCPVILPRFPGRESFKIIDEDEKEYETEEQFNERMNGMFALYLAILQTQFDNVKNAFPTEKLWIWIARVLNIPIHPRTSMFIAAFIDVGGGAFVETYGKQAHKILLLILNEIIPKLPPESVSSTTRLKIALEDYMRTGKLITDTQKSRMLDT